MNLDLEKFNGSIFDNKVKSTIIISHDGDGQPYFEMLPINSIVTCDYRPDRYRIFVNNVEEKIISYISRG